ncbi:thyrotroph embryonic factor-like isoform X2 [Neocloeon triangulifer]|uniref:thyrotroph embryonic factor-like isoform X2 n=1 Tax=Neocloeon triangulifer TaxID=2078957 RepID=UPI00286F47A5|nr:thyrotroph embryonic factor-like isoform X2 [Neocloeon triangulifer]
MSAHFHATDISCQSNSNNYPQDQQQWTRSFQVHQHRNSEQTAVKSAGEMENKSKEDANENAWVCAGQSAFLGPCIWDKNIPHNPDLRIGAQYIDLDDFLSENGIPLEQSVFSNENGQTWKRNDNDSDSQQNYSQNVAKLGVVAEVLSLNGKGEYSMKYQGSSSPPHACSSLTSSSSKDELESPTCSSYNMYYSMSGNEFDPRTRPFSDEELKPQVMVKKSRKKFVPEDMKDDKYWARRRKNNIAAKRSRDARRLKENQIALRAGFLEKENSFLRKEVEKLKKDNNLMRLKLEKTQKN